MIYKEKKLHDLKQLLIKKYISLSAYHEKKEELTALERTKSTVDMEINHPVYGWIPFTASPTDSEVLGRELHAASIAGALGTIAVAPTLPPPPAYTPTELEVLKQVLETAGVLTTPRIAAATSALIAKGRK